MKLFKYFSVFVLFFLLNNLIYSEEKFNNLVNSSTNILEKENFAISLNGGFLFNLHSVNFKKFPNMLACETYEKSFGTGYLFSVGFEKNLTKKFNFLINKKIE